MDVRPVVLVALLLAGCAAPNQGADKLVDSAPAQPRHLEWFDVSVTPTAEGSWASYRWSLPTDAFIHTDGTEPGAVIDVVPRWDGDGGPIQQWAILFFVEREGKAAFAGGYLASEQFEHTFNEPANAVTTPASERPINFFIGYGNLVALLATARSTDGLYGESLGITPGESVFVALTAKGPSSEPFHVAFRTGVGNPSFTDEALDAGTEVGSARPLSPLGSGSGLAIDYYERTTVLGVKFETWTANVHHSDVANPLHEFQDNVNLETLDWQGGAIAAGWGVMGFHVGSIGLTSVRGRMAMLNDTRDVDAVGGVDAGACASGSCAFVPSWGRFAEGSGSGERGIGLRIANVGTPYLDQLSFFAITMTSGLEGLVALGSAGHSEPTYPTFPP